MIAALTRRTGLGFRPELAADLLLDRSAVGFVEVVAESCFAQRCTWNETMALAEMWPVVPHGVKLSLGSAEGIDDRRARRLGRLARDVRAPVVSEHVSFTRGGGREIGHLTQLPRTRAAVKAVARNVDALRRRLPDVPLLLENVAWSFRWPASIDEMDEPSFYQEIVARTGCDLLLDVSNLYANAVNDGFDPLAVVGQFPLDRVAMVHVAGGVIEEGFYFDTHAHPVGKGVFDCVARVLESAPDVPMLIERDAGFDSFSALRDELAVLERLEPPPGHDGARPIAFAAGARAAAKDETIDARDQLAQQQGEVAALLTEWPLPAGPLASAIGWTALERARAILQRKRVDEALPLLARLSARRGAIQRLAERALEGTPRALRGAGPCDARTIARVLADVPAWRADALVDLLMLSARFSELDSKSRVTPRWLPFRGRIELGNGAAISVSKGFGAFAPITSKERKAPSWSASSQVSPRK